MGALSASVAIIGAGPIGIELAVKRGKGRGSIICISTRGRSGTPFPGSRAGDADFSVLMNGSRSQGIPLFTPDQTKCTREQYLAYLRGIVVQFDLKVNTYEPVVKIDREGGRYFVLTTRRGGAEREVSGGEI